MRCCASLLIAMSTFAAAAQQADSAPTATNDSFTLWQLPNQTSSQIMSYVIKTVHGKVIVIDGGMAGDAPYLTEFLTGLGGNIEAWFITHPHDDHFNALGEILKQPGTLTIGSIYGSLPDAAWIEQWGNDGEKKSYGAFVQALNGAGRKVEELSLGQVLEIDGIQIEILGVKNPELTKNAINNSSIVVRIADVKKSILFLGDLGLEGGEKLLKGPYASRLPSDYVQMAHHGQNGVSEAVYQQIRPTYCLWPTPKWLWDNDNGGGPGSGPWRTLEVRAWMDKMAIKKHYVMFEGVHRIE
ncbi:MAG: MBL fold metallo-hydrolase [Candidatus Hydrogenedentes bacterium]|nr:MBL fold metallo-hydrolase [Candidatus Hydrogenedentota bacterium]